MIATTGEWTLLGAPTQPAPGATRAWPLVAVLAVVAIVGASAAAPGAPAIEAPPGAVLSLDRRDSHDHRYRAEVVAASIALDTDQRWIVRLTRRNGRRVAHASVAAQVTMPESTHIAPAPATVRYVAGRYEISGMRFTTPGWWNVALTIDGAAGRDSVAFNVIVPGK